MAGLLGMALDRAQDEYGARLIARVTGDTKEAYAVHIMDALGPAWDAITNGVGIESRSPRFHQLSPVSFVVRGDNRLLEILANPDNKATRNLLRRLGVNLPVRAAVPTWIHEAVIAFDYPADPYAHAEQMRKEQRKQKEGAKFDKLVAAYEENGTFIDDHVSAFLEACINKLTVASIKKLAQPFLFPRPGKPDARFSQLDIVDFAIEQGAPMVPVTAGDKPDYAVTVGAHDLLIEGAAARYYEWRMEVKRKAEARKYHVIAMPVDKKTGEVKHDAEKTYMTTTPVTHDEAITVASKFTPRRDRVIRLEEVT